LKDIRQRLLAVFQIEHRDHVEQIRSLLAMMEKTDGPGPGPELEEIFRRAHSLKGAARAVDLRSVEGLAHRMETLFSRVRQGTLPLDKEASAVVQQALDASEDCVMALGENRPTPGFGPALLALERVLGIEPEAADSPKPEIAEPRTPADRTFRPLETVRITAQNFDGLLLSAGGLLSESYRQRQVTEQLHSVARRISVMEKDAQAVRRSVGASARRLGLRREFARVDSFLESMKQGTRALSRKTNALCRLQQRSSWAMSRMSKQLQRDVWQARMIPAETLLEGYRRMMQDLARDESKQIEFNATSTGVHADRRVLDSLKDPLMHALRNAVCHGIELPRERIAKGKSPVGQVTLQIEAKGPCLSILVEDDGRGIDLARVTEVAVKQGILSESEARGCSPQEIARILFRPGFSTSRSVSDLSGRGMGLSVVYEAVRRLQGDVDIQQREHAGTAIHLSAPLSISTHRLMLASCGDQLFAIPIHSIERLCRIKRASVETVEGKPVFTIDAQPVPLFSLSQLLRVQPSPASPEQDFLRVMILRTKAMRAAVVVDSFLWESDAVIQDLGPASPPDGRISGGILLDDGGIAFVLDPIKLLQTSVPAQQTFQAKPVEPIQAAAFSILVVDDSITTRLLEKSILEAHGYQVRVAVDGIEALAQLRAEKADLVISDIQMPRLDGFGLLEAMKKDRNLERIPVIVVSSLETREEQERGLSLGADAYIVKRKFDQGELLAAIRQIL
jgi:two-component system chemotaxis sensor kinase CheA